MTVELIALLILPSLVAIESRKLSIASLGYCVLSLMMSLIFLLNGHVSWAIVALIGNGVIVSTLLLIGVKLTKNYEETQRFKSPISAFLVLLFTSVIALILSMFIPLQITFALVIFSLGFYTLVMKSNLIKTLIGFCLIENGLHLSVFYIAPEIPVILEIGAASYMIGSVVTVLLILIELYRRSQLVDSHELMEVRW